MDKQKAAVPELVLDDGSQSGFVSFFRGLHQDPKIIRIFDRKGFYSIHGEHALQIAQQFYKTTAVVKYFGSSNPLPGVTLNRNMMEAVLKELLVEKAEFTVNLYEGHGQTWKLVRSGSPGRLGDFEDEILRSSDAIEVPTIIAVVTNIVDGERTVGAAYVDLGIRRLGACQFHDDMEYCTLEALVVQLGARECAIPQESESSAQTKELSKVKDVMLKCRAMTSERPKAMYSTKNLEMDLQRLIKSNSIEQHRDVLERPLAKSALAAVISMAELLSDTAHHGKLDLCLHDLGCSMRLDAAAQKALNMFPQRTDEAKLFSLYGLLNQARTAMGKRKLKVWMKQPLVTVEDVNSRLDFVEAFVNNPNLRMQVRDLLRGFPDVDRLSRKLARKKCTLADLCQLYRASSKLPVLEQQIRDAGLELLDRKYAELFAALHDEEHLTRYEQLIEAAIDLEKVPDEYLISPEYNSGLEELCGEKEEAEKQINALFRDAADDLGLDLDKKIKLEWYKANNKKLRCLRITQNEERSVRKKLQQRYSILETRKDGTKFVSPAFRRAAEHLQGLSKQYDIMQSDLVVQVISVAATFLEVFEDMATAVAEIDVLAGLAEIAVNAPVPYVRPKILGSECGQINLRGCRHPLLEAQDGVDFIKNDCDLVREESWFQIITGPNMGGKSTFIRQVGVCVLMAQIGSFVPCDEATIAVRDAIFARVGAGDCQLRGVSTFMAEMLETAAILKGATDRSLVIIDELGRGTSTYDGFGLAWAISHHIMQVIGCPTLFATHFHELTALSGPVGVKNLHVETCIDDATGKLTMLYQVLDGACDQSFGIHVAEFARFPAGVVSSARKRLRDLEDRDKELTTLWEKRKKTDTEKDAYASIDKFIDELASIPVENSPSEASKQEFDKLLNRIDLEAQQNPALKRLLG